MPKEKKFDEEKGFKPFSKPEKKKYGDKNVEQEKEDFYDAPVTKPMATTHKDVTPPVSKPVSITREGVIPPVVKKPVAIPAEKGNPYYKKTLWHNVKEVWQCNTCGVFRVTEEAAIAHILIHVPRDQHKTLQAQLTKEIKHD